jgi:precorrin-6B methylase 2
LRVAAALIHSKPEPKYSVSSVATTAFRESGAGGGPVTVHLARPSSKVISIGGRHGRNRVRQTNRIQAIGHPTTTL